MKYSEKKKVEEFVVKILETIEQDMHTYNHVSRIVHNGKVEIKEFLDDDLSTEKLKCFKLT